MSLAEELLADLDDVADDDVTSAVASSASGISSMVRIESASDDLIDLAAAGTVNWPSAAPNDVKANGDLSSTDSFSNARITEFAKLRNSERLEQFMSDLDHFVKAKRQRKSIQGPIEADPEYQCIIEANNLMAEIDNEINIIHKYVRDLYSKRFPELESLVPASLDYLKVVAVLGNDILDRSKQTSRLAAFLTPATIMVLSVTASTTQGSPLSPDQLDRSIEAANMAVELYDMRAVMLTYVESRMSSIAPNISALVGASTAAKLMGHAGGLTSLSKMPSCNVLVLGAQKRLLTGFNQASTLPHTGYIFHADVVQKLPPDLRIKAARLLANKVALAARFDLFHNVSDGNLGEKFVLEVERKFDKWQEPPPVKTIKALPAPLEPPSKKRGGKRYRKLKERLGMSDLRRSANRIQFGQISDDAYQTDIGFSMGSLGQKSGSNAGSGNRLRAPQADAKTKARVSKALQNKLTRYGGLSTMPTTSLGAASSSGFSTGGNSTVRGRSHVSGTSSSIAFTPLQGLEIVNPQAAERRVEAGNKYFASTCGFVNLNQQQSVTNNKPDPS